MDLATFNVLSVYLVEKVLNDDVSPVILTTVTSLRLVFAVEFLVFGTVGRF